MFDDGDQAAGLRQLFAAMRPRAIPLVVACDPQLAWVWTVRLMHAYRTGGLHAGLVDLLGTDMRLTPDGPAFARIDGRDLSFDRAVDRITARGALQRVVLAGHPHELLALTGSTVSGPRDAGMKGIVCLLSNDAADATRHYAMIKSLVFEHGIERIGLVGLGRPVHGAGADAGKTEGLAAARARLAACVRRFTGVQPLWLDDTETSAPPAPGWIDQHGFDIPSARIDPLGTGLGDDEPGSFDQPAFVKSGHHPIVDDVHPAGDS